jgi:hypothetical protein
MKSMVSEITELQALPLPGLVARYKDVFGKEPASTSKELLWKEIVWKIQADRAGGTPEGAATKVERLTGDVTFAIKKMTKTESPTPTSRRRKPDEPPVGTVIVRMWHGQEVRLQVLDGGYEVDGVVYRTLSAAAKAITGAHWNGRLFFGLKNRKRKS